MTVFLSLIMICVCSLMAALFQSARYAGARWYLQMASASAVDSVMSQYHRQMWERYHLLGLEFEDEAEVASDYRKYVESYFKGGTFYPMGVQSGEVDELVRMTDEGGDMLEMEITDYMKYGIWNKKLDPSGIPETIKNLAGASQVREVARAYEKRSKDTIKLEQGLESISDTLKQYGLRYREAEAGALVHSLGIAKD